MRMDDQQLDLIITRWYLSLNPIQQLAAEVCIRILEGRFRKDETLPAPLDWSEELETSELAAIMAIKQVAEAGTGLIEGRGRGYYAVAVDVPEDARPPGHLPAAWLKGASAVSMMKGGIAGQVLTGEIRGGERISPGTVAGQWHCDETEAQIAMRLLCQWPGLVRQDEKGFIAVAGK